MTRDPYPASFQRPVRLSAERDFALGDLEVHPSVSETVRGGTRQHVEPRVMQVLVALAAAAGAVVSRDELIERCWDGRVVGEAAINRCISRLRALADRGDGTRSFNVETIPRVGYRLQACEGIVKDGIGHVVEPAERRVDEGSAAGDVEKSIPPAPPPQAPRARRAVLLAIGVAAILAVAAVAVMNRGGASRALQPAASAAARPSIAVLPFKDLSADADAAYFAAAIQDEILTRLTKIGSLKVISRTSAVEAVKEPGTLADIARRLGVANVLEGSVQRSGDKVRVNVQLIRAKTDAHLWAEAYDRRLDDVLLVENEIAGSIATALAATITPGESRALAATPTTNAKAYDLYLHALVLYAENEEAPFRSALVALQEAVAIDPDFALAWAMLVRVESTFYFSNRDAETRARARHALDRAMALAPDLAEVQLAHAQYRHYVELDYGGAADELRALHAQWPNNIEILQWLALVERRLGHFERAIAYLRKAQILDPLSRNNLGWLAETLLFSHRPAEAAGIVSGARAVWPDDPTIAVCQAGHLQGLGDLDRADASLVTVPTSTDAGGFTLTERRAQYAYRRRFAEGLAWFEALRTSSPVQTWTPVQRATLALAIGDFRRWTGDLDGARESYRAAADELRENADSENATNDALSLTAMAYSGLGDRPSALRYIQRLAETPLSSDPINGAEIKQASALTLARLGDRDAALAELEPAVREPSQMTPGRLRFDPDFDALRSDPRFEQLIAASAQPLE